MCETNSCLLNHCGFSYHFLAIIRLQESISKLNGELSTQHNTIMKLNNKTSGELAEYSSVPVCGFS